MKKIAFILLSVVLLASFTLLHKNRLFNNQLNADFKGAHRVFTGEKFVFFDDSTRTVLFGGELDTSSTTPYRLEMTSFKRVPGNYSIGTYVSISLIQNIVLNGSDSVVVYNGQSGHIYISNYDTIQQKIEGNFNCTLINYFTHDTLNIQNGYFNLQNN